MFEIAVEQEIAAGHQLRGYQGKCEKCHGHNWKIRLEVTAEQVDSLGLAMDFHALKALLNDILEPYDHTLLNDLPEFMNQNPTSENLAKCIYQRCKDSLSRLYPDISIQAVVVWESSRAFVRYHE